MVFPLTLIDDSDYTVYDIYDINQYWIRISRGIASFKVNPRTNHVHCCPVPFGAPGWFMDVAIEKVQSESIFSLSTSIWYHANHPLLLNFPRESGVCVQVQLQKWFTAISRNHNKILRLRNQNYCWRIQKIGDDHELVTSHLMMTGTWKNLWCGQFGFAMANGG